MATAQVGGKLAQIGSRLIDSTAKKMANDFFGKFAEEVGGKTEAENVPQPAPAPEPEPVAAASQERPPGLSPKVWVAGLIAAAVLVLVLLQL